MAQQVDAGWLASEQGQVIIAEAQHFSEPLAAVVQLRKRHPDINPQHITQALTQATLRTRLASRWNVHDLDVLLTEDGIEQASRPTVSAYRAQVIRERFGTHARILDLTCGLGFDALAMAQAGLDVTCIERDPVTADLARFNLRHTSTQVVTADCTALPTGTQARDNSQQCDVHISRDRYDAVFIDPARRDPGAARNIDGTSQRIFDPEQWSPSWSFITNVSNVVPVVAKLAPGIDQSHVAGWDAEWISVDGNLVETMAISSGSGQRTATLLGASSNVVTHIPGHQLHAIETPTAPLGEYLVIPDAALIRAQALDYLAGLIEGGLVNPHIAWLTTSSHEGIAKLAKQPLIGTALRIEHILPFNEKVLSQAIATMSANALTIMTRGVTVDVEKLRKRLFKQRDAKSPELVLAIYRDDPNNVALLCRRISMSNN